MKTTRHKVVLVLTGVPDSAFNGGSPARIELGTSLYPASLTFSTTAGNQPPSISAISNQTVFARQPAAPAPFTVGDDTDAANSLALTPATSSEDIVPLAGIVFGGAGSNRTVTVTGGRTAGEATVTVYVSDSYAQTNQTSFTVTVLPDPVLSPVSHTNTLVNTPVTTALVVNSVAVPPGNLTLSAASGNTNLVPDAAITFGGSGSNRTVTVAPASGLDGVAPISVSVSDGLSTATASFVVMVLPGGNVRFLDHFDYNSDGNLNLLSAGFWAQRTTGTRIVGVTNREVTFYGPAGSSYESVIAPLAGAPHLSGGGKIFYTSVKATWTFPPRSSSGPFVHLNNAAGNQFAKVHLTTNDVPEGRFRLGLAAGPGAAYTDFARDLELNTTYRIVTRYDQDAGTSTLWIDPASEASENVTATDVPGGSVEQIGLRNQSGMGAIVLDNLTVSVLAKPLLTLGRMVGGAVELYFTAAAGDAPSDFTVIQATTVDGVYGEVSAVIVSTGPGAFRATVPVSGNQGFFRIQRKPLTF